MDLLSIHASNDSNDILVIIRAIFTKADFAWETSSFAANQVEQEANISTAEPQNLYYFTLHAPVSCLSGTSAEISLSIDVVFQCLRLENNGAGDFLTLSGIAVHDCGSSW